jgi:hypothetical protein
LLKISADLSADLAGTGSKFSIGSHLAAQIATAPSAAVGKKLGQMGS